MIEIVIGNSISQVKGFDKHQYSDLRKILRYKKSDQSIYFSNAWGVPYVYLIDRYGKFPTGLLYLVEQYLVDTSTPHYKTDTRVRPPGMPVPVFTLNLPLTPYPVQIEASQAILEHHRGILSAPTGLGKSVIIAMVINSLQVRTLVVVPNLELKRQLTECLRTWFGASQVGNQLEEGKAIVVANVGSLNPILKPVGYHCVIIDEFHHAAAESYRALNEKAWTDVYYRLGTTATPFRSKDNERLLLEGVLSKVIHTIDYHYAVAKGYICPVEAYYVDLPRTMLKGGGNTWASVYSELVVSNQYRNQLIQDLLIRLHKQKVSTLCLVKEIKHGNILADDGAFHFVKGENDDNSRILSQFSQGSIPVLIGTTGVVGEGVDTKAAEWVIIAGLGKSKNQFMQQVGRAVRKYSGKETAKVVIFRDVSHKWTAAHFKAQCKILLEEYGTVPIKLDI